MHEASEREYLLEESLTRLEEEFGNRFLRIHRSCLVARNRIDRFERAGEEAADGGWVTVLRGLDERTPGEPASAARHQGVWSAVMQPGSSASMLCVLLVFTLSVSSAGQDRAADVWGRALGLNAYRPTIRRSFETTSRSHATGAQSDRFVRRMLAP